MGSSWDAPGYSSRRAPAWATPQPARGRGVVLLITGAAASGLVTLTLLGFLARSWWVFELVSNLRPHLGGALLVLAAVALGLRSRSLAIVTVVAAVANLVFVAPYLLPSRPVAAPAGAQTLDVTFLNTKIHQADPDQVIAYLRDREDDVVVLAATNPEWVGRIQAADLDLEMVAGPGMPGSLELLTLVRDPDAEVIVHRPTQHDRDALVEVVTTLNGEPVHVLATHAVSPQTPTRALRRNASLDWIAAWSRGRGPSSVLMGDLNTAPWSPNYRDMLADGSLVDPRADTIGLEPTWPAVLGPLGIPIDHILHGAAMTATEHERGPAFGSEHRVVHATVTQRVADAGR